MSQSYRLRTLNLVLNRRVDVSFTFVYACERLGDRNGVDCVSQCLFTVNKHAAVLFNWYFALTVDFLKVVCSRSLSCYALKSSTCEQVYFNLCF